VRFYRLTVESHSNNRINRVADMPTVLVLLTIMGMGVIRQSHRARLFSGDPHSRTERRV
jgi:hypothetical protein